MSPSDAYSEVADEQLDALEAGTDTHLCDAVLDACELVFENTRRAQSLSTAITTPRGHPRQAPVAGHPPYKLFWSTTPDGPRVEAVFPHP